MNFATSGKGARLLTAGAYAALFLVGVDEGLIGSFQYSRNVPFGAIAFCVVLLATCLLGAWACLLYTSPSPRDRQKSRMPSSA